MNKFIAMLRDSYKEAVDGRIFLVMLVLSGILIVLVGSMSVKPIPPERAIPLMIDPKALMFVSAERGAASRTAIFNTQPSTSDVTVTKREAQPWDSEVQFTFTYQSSGMGPSGVEVGNARKAEDIKPENVKPIEGTSGVFSDPFKESVRYWASPAGSKDRLKYTDELAIEFVTHQLRAVSGLNITHVEKAKSGKYAFAVTAAGAPRVAWTHKPSLFFGAVPLSFLEQPLGTLVYWVENKLLNGIGAWVVLLAGVVVTAGFIPNMLRKGAIDLLLTKPMSRPLILLYKYLGGLLFVFLLTAITAGGVWLAVGLRSGIWSLGPLYAVFGITFYFSILYACSTLFGVLSRNAIVSIVTTVVFWFLVFIVGFAHTVVSALDNLELPQQRARHSAAAEKKGDDEVDQEIEQPKPPRWLVQTTRILNRVTPRTNDLDTLTGRLIGENLLSEAERRQQEKATADVDWPEVLAVSVAYIALFLGLASIRFVTRSY